VTVRNRQNLRRSIMKPLVSCSAVALWAMTVAAGSICDYLMTAMVALLHLSAKRGGTARADISECLTLLGRQHVSPTIQELPSMLLEDLGDFQPRWRHRRRPLPSGCITAMTCRLSKGLAVALSVRLETCKYRAVVSRSAWPSKSWMTRKSVPASSRCVA